MKYEKCVKIGPKYADRPLLHRKTGTISVGNIHRRRLLSPSMAIFKSSVALSNRMDSKHVHWASPIKREHSFIAPAVSPATSTVQEDTIPPKPAQMATMDLQLALSLMTKTAKAMCSTPYFCFDCQQYYSSQSKLKRHKDSQKHQLQVLRQSFADSLGETKSAHVGAASSIKPDVADVEMDAIEIVTKPLDPLDISLFYCSICQQQYASRKQWNRHQKTKKHFDNVLINQLRKQWQHHQQTWR